jgi:hypothetical protein
MRLSLRRYAVHLRRARYRSQILREASHLAQFVQAPSWRRPQCAATRRRKRARQGTISIDDGCVGAIAVTGDPNGGNLPNWPRYDATRDCYFEFGDELRVGNSWRAAQMDFLDAYFDVK